MTDKNFRVRFEDADESGFLAAAESEIDSIILSHLREQNRQKSINRRILVSATRGQIRAAGKDVLRYRVFLDWRGRLYYNGAGLAPQGKDFGRGCLEAATPTRLGISGLRHLIIGTATTLGWNGLDKAGMRARVRGVVQMLRDDAEGRRDFANSSLGKMVREARDHTGYMWRTAEEPVQFVALASDLLTALQSGNAFDHASAAFVGYDATCSGLQVLSMVCGDTATGLHVNTVPRADGSRADIYMAVADALKARCAEIAGRMTEDEADSLIEIDREMSAQARADRAAGIKTKRAKSNTNGDHWGVYWHRRGVNRSITKRPVMVYCYGGTKRTFAGSIAETCRENGEAAPWKACMWLAAEMYDNVLAELLPRAHKFMLALQEVARVLARNGKSVRFTSADGLPFDQAVMETEKDRVSCPLIDGRRPLIVIQSRTNRLNAQKQASGIAPNVVHQWDSLFLRRAILALNAAGIRDFYTVHDCFYLRAGDWARGQKIIRQAFVDTFKPDVAAQLWKAIEDATGVQLPPCPVRGDMDLDAPLRSPFLFS